MEGATNEGSKRVDRSPCSTHEGLNEALKRTNERKELERVGGREVGTQRRLLEKYAMLYVTSATVCERVSHKERCCKTK